jgi:predicted MFS family arabinose efflux permease
VGRILPNLAADYFGPLNLFTLMSLLNAGMAFAFFGADKSTSGLIAITVIYGLTSGAFISLLGPAIFGFAKTQSEVGKRGGFAFVALSFAALTGSPIGGALVDKYGFDAAIAFCGCLTGLGGIVIGTATVLTAREKGTRKV